MNYLQMTAPCGLDCFNCQFYLAKTDQEALMKVEELSKQFNIPVATMLCNGCRNHDGRIPLQKHIFGEAHRCVAYECSKSRNLDFCGDCEEFPCDTLHPYADKAAILPHNTKVFNLCLIKKLGLEKWAEDKASRVRETYFTKPWTLK